MGHCFVDRLRGSKHALAHSLRAGLRRRGLEAAVERQRKVDGFLASAPLPRGFEESLEALRRVEFGQDGGGQVSFGHAPSGLWRLIMGERDGARLIV